MVWEDREILNKADAVIRVLFNHAPKPNKNILKIVESKKYTGISGNWRNEEDIVNDVIRAINIQLSCESTNINDFDEEIDRRNKFIEDSLKRVG